MDGRRRWIAVGALAVLALSACSKSGASAESASAPPVKVRAVEGTDLHRVAMSAKAVERLGLETAKVTDAPSSAAGPHAAVIPYAALIYDPSGATWVYTGVGPHTYQRHAVTVARITGDTVTLAEGPPAGTDVVTVGVAEVYGSEFSSEE